MKKEKEIKENKLIPIILLFLIICANGFADSSSDSLQDARELEKQGKNAQASLLYQEWFKGNQNHSDFFQVLLHFSDVEESPFTILSIYALYLDVLKDGRQKHLLEQRIALLYELLGEFDRALSYYKAAYGDIHMWENDRALLDPAKLLLAQGLYTQAEDWLIIVKPVLKEDDVYAEMAFLMTKIYILSHQEEKAIRLLLKIKAKFRNSHILPQSLLELIELYCEKGAAADAQSVFNELETRFAHSPEHELAAMVIGPPAAAAPLIDFYPLPYRYLSDPQADTQLHTEVPEQTQNRPESVETAQEKKPYLVCVGSFRVRENARQRQSELKSKGISAQLCEKTVKNQLYYRVVLENDYTYDQGRQMIDTLKGLGYGESFLIKNQ
jgi:tetratricopeptide (TPR) repeat protein